jgi:hypothetical protein
MKLNYKIKSFALVAAFAATLAACTEDIADVRLEPGLNTIQNQNVTAFTAEVEGYITAQNEGFTEVGVVYSTSENPSLSDGSKVIFGEERTKAAFKVTLTDLDYATKYYARAYGIYPGGTIYGAEQTFTTLPRVPMVSISSLTYEDGASAAFTAEVNDDGRGEVTERGVVYATAANPTVETGDKVVDDEAGLGVFEGVLEELLGNTAYFVRAYAINKGGVGYGEDKEFITEILWAEVETGDVTAINKTTATLNGATPYDGGAEITARGFVWGLSDAPGLNDNLVDMMDAEGDAFSFVLEELDLNTVYYVRAFATNSKGTAFGETKMFKTLADITKLHVVGDYNEWTNDASAPYIISTESSEGLAVGYIYLTAGGFKLIMEPGSWADETTFGDDGTGNLTNPGANIPVAEDGYYYITANLSDMSYTLLKMNWGIIGDATPGGWDAQTALTYDSELKVLKGAYALTAGAFKFRANDNWSNNYGSNDADGNLQVDGANIPVAVAGDYAVTLDLSTPNVFKYEANHWGLIGGATPGGWDSDTFMTWDATNKVFTVTVDLTTDQYKFRANGAWDINLGGALGALEPNGSNIDVTAGNYTITLDPWTKVATATLNE